LLKIPWLPHLRYQTSQPTSNDPDSLETLRQLFTREAQALEKLGNYDQIPQLLAHFEDLEFYLVQEFVPGHPLSAELKLINAGAK